MMSSIVKKNVTRLYVCILFRSIHKYKKTNNNN